LKNEGNNALTKWITPAKDRFQVQLDAALSAGSATEIETLQLFRSDVAAYVRAYDFLSQIIDLGDTGLEKRALFYRLLIPVLADNNLGSEGPAVIRELIGALAYRGWRRGAFVTTAETFSAEAKNTAAAEGLLRDGYSIDLYTYDALRELVRATLPLERPWLDLVFEHYLSAADVAELRRRQLK